MKELSHTAMLPNVHVLKPPQSRVHPPADWLLDGKFGHMAFEAGDTGRLVRLADVLRWLQSSRGLPRSEALKPLCDGLNTEVMGWLYWLQPTTWAMPLSPTYVFGYLTAEQIAEHQKKKAEEQRDALWERGERNFRFDAPVMAINGQIRLNYPEPTEPGLTALLKYLREKWVLLTSRGAKCDVLDDVKIRHATTLAIRLDKAHELWGYGRIERNEKVINMPDIEPPTGWKLHDPRGYMAFDGIRAGRVVALFDLVNWMMEEKQLPCGEVVSLLCKKIQADAGAKWLYVLQTGQFAKPLENDYSFAWEPIVPFWDEAKPVDTANLGVAGLVKHLRSYWSDAIAPGASNYMGQEVLDPIAMPIIKAHELFGYGCPTPPIEIVSANGLEPTSWAELIAFRKRHQLTTWSTTQKSLIASEKLRRNATPGAKGIAKAMASELGITVSRLNEHIREADELGKRAVRLVKAA